jgi:carboxyl-terminal processing protease
MRLGVIDLPSFYAPMSVGSKEEKAEARWTSVDVAKLLKKFKEEKVSGVILDLRHNGGGSLDEAIKLTGLFIKDGPVVQVRDPDGSVQVDEDRDPAIAYDGPLIVLTSKFSASASEIAAGALQDYGRALIVGDASTHGKGTVQSVNSLEPFMKTREDASKQDPGALKMTIRKFYRANGESTQVKGVTPDIVLPSVWNVPQDIGEAALDNRLEWDTINSAKFDPVNRVQPYLEELRRRETNRLTAEKDYEYVREDIEQVKKFQADKTVSLNEKQRLEEKAEADARKQAREKDLLARKAPDETIYEIRVKLAEQPGLPAPVARTNGPALARAGVAIPGAATNLAAASPAAAHPPAIGTDPADGEDEKIPTVDVALIEAEHILVDYLSLLPKETVLTVNKTSATADTK